MGLSPVAERVPVPLIRRSRTAPLGVLGALLLVIGLTAPLAILVPLPLLGAGTMALVLVVIVFLHPPFAAYALITMTPLLAGLERGSLIPAVRPHEALAAV